MKKHKRKNDKYSNADITIIALLELEGITNFIHLEDIAMKAGALSPSRFSWEKYPDQINIEKVRLSLKNELSSPNNRVTGGIKEGWILTPSGISWCRQHTKFDEALGKKMAAKIDREISLIKLTSAFQKYKKGKIDTISDLELFTLLRIDGYFSKRNYRERVLAFCNISCFDLELQDMLLTLKKQGLKQLEVING
jgi:hypothetical protein